MDFRKKLKIRLSIAIGYIILGLAMIITFNIIKTENEFLSSFGFALIVIGIVQIRKYIMITKNEETIIKRQIAETDERNISIANRAKSISFIIYVLLAAVLVIVLELLNKTQLAMIISGTICVLILIYWISYWIISKKS
ncbi:MAG: hypothetical protein IJO86_01085 [Oscillospiraceae bacterium]|nr:hypothetical protein [Oscillospiraceae bacterium]